MWTLTSSINRKHQKQQKIKNKKPKTHTTQRDSSDWSSSKATSESNRGGGHRCFYKAANHQVIRTRPLHEHGHSVSNQCLEFHFSAFYTESKFKFKTNVSEKNKKLQIQFKLNLEPSLSDPGSCFRAGDEGQTRRLFSAVTVTTWGYKGGRGRGVRRRTVGLCLRGALCGFYSLWLLFFKVLCWFHCGCGFKSPALPSVLGRFCLSKHVTTIYSHHTAAQWSTAGAELLDAMLTLLSDQWTWNQNRTSSAFRFIPSVHSFHCVRHVLG